MSELVTECGGRISTESNLYNMVQSSVSVDVPLYISYIFHVGGLQHYDLRSHLRLIFVYDSAILWQKGISPPKDAHHGGHLFPTSMKMANDGRLVVNFRTEARFHGAFVLSNSKTRTFSTVVSKKQPDLTCTLHLVKTEPTFAEPEQEWEFISDVAVRDYSGTYTVRLIPCVVWDDIVYSTSVPCNPQEPVVFELEVRFQQVSDPVPSQFSLNTHFFLTKQRELWLYNGSTEYQDAWDTSFQQGDKVYGRIMVDPVQNLGDSFHLNIEKCFLCTGVDGYIPKYNPHENEFGCIADSSNLLYNFKIIDRVSPSSVVFDLRSIPFNAVLVRDDQELKVEQLLDWPGSDGFSFSPDPLFQASQGRQWFIHCMFTVKSQYRMARHFHRRSVRGVFGPTLGHKSRIVRDITDIQGVGEDGRGTNLHRLELQMFGEKTSSYTGVQKPEGNSKFHLWWLSVTSSVFASVLLVVTVWVIICRHNDRRTSKKEATISERLRTMDTTVCGTSHSRSSLQNFTTYCAVPSKDSTEV